MQAIRLINLCAREYQDTAFVRIAKSPSGNTANWLDLLNDAQRAVVLARPDANPVTSAVLLVAGTRQTLPSGKMRLLDVSRNMGSNGTTPGDTIRLAERDVQDMVNRSWHNAQPQTRVREVFYNDKKDPLVYWVYPPIAVGATVYIEVTTSDPPTDVTDADNGAITLSDTYASPLQAWMLYRAFSMQSQAVGLAQRAQGYFASFFNLLGVKLRNDMIYSPNEPDILPGVQRGAR
jgi:hypothetical protein